MDNILLDPTTATWAARLARHRVPERYRDSYQRMLKRLSGAPRHAGGYRDDDEFDRDLQRVAGIAADLTASVRITAVVEHHGGLEGGPAGYDDGPIEMVQQLVRDFALHTNAERQISLIAAPPALLSLWAGRGGWQHQALWYRMTVLGPDEASVPDRAAEEFCRVWDRDPDSAYRTFERICDPGYDGLLAVRHDSDPWWMAALFESTMSELSAAIGRIGSGDPRPSAGPGSTLSRIEGQVDRMAGGATDPGWEHPWPPGVQRGTDAANLICGIALPAAVLHASRVSSDGGLADALDGMAPAVDMASCQLLHERFAGLDGPGGAWRHDRRLAALVPAACWLAEQALYLVHGAKDHTRLDGVEARLRAGLAAAGTALDMLDGPVLETVAAVAGGQAWPDAAWVHESRFPAGLASQAAAALRPARTGGGRQWPVGPGTSAEVDLADRDARWTLALDAFGGEAAREALESGPLAFQPGEAERFAAAGASDADFAGAYLDVRDRPDRMAGLNLSYTWSWDTEGFAPENVANLGRFAAAYSHFRRHGSPEDGVPFVFSAASGLYGGGPEATFVAAGVADPADMDRLRAAGADAQDVAAYARRGAATAEEMLALRDADKAATHPAALEQPTGAQTGPSSVPGQGRRAGVKADTCAWWPQLRAPLEEQLHARCYLWLKDVDGARAVFELICWPLADDAERISAAEARGALNALHRRWVTGQLQAGGSTDAFGSFTVAVGLRVERRGLQARYIGHGDKMVYLEETFPGTTFALSDQGTANGRQCVGLHWAGGPGTEDVTDVIASKGPIESVDVGAEGVWVTLWKGYILLVRASAQPVF